MIRTVWQKVALEKGRLFVYYILNFGVKRDIIFSRKTAPKGLHGGL